MAAEPYRLRDECLWPVLALCIGWIAFVHPAIGWFTATPGDLGDARFNSVILEHVYRWLIGLEPSLWSPRFYYPFEGTLAFSDNHFGSIAPYVAARALGLERELALDVWFVSGLLLTCLCAHWAARGFGLSPMAAAFTAFFFTFGLPALAQTGHVQLTYRFAIPLAVLSYWRWLTRADVRHLFTMTIWLAWQFLCSIYLGLFLALLLLSLMAVTWRRPQTRAMLEGLDPRQWRGPRSWQIYALAAIALLAVLLLGAILLKYKTIAGSYGFKRSRGEIRSMLPQLGSYLVSDFSALSAWMGAWIQNLPMRHEHHLSLGIGGWLLFFLGARLARRQHSPPPWGKPMLWSIVLLFLLTINLWGASLYSLLMPLPGFNSIRSVTRIICVMMWPMALLMGLYLQATRRLVIPALLVVVVVADIAWSSSSSTPIAHWHARQQLLAEQYPAKPPASPILLVRRAGSDPFHMAELDAMIFAQDRGLPTLNGYSGNVPPGMVDVHACTDATLRLQDHARFMGLAPSSVQSSGARIVELNRALCPDGVVDVGSGALPDELIQHLRLTISALQITPGEFQATIHLYNGSSRTLHTLSNTGQSVDLAWRFIPTTASASVTRKPPPWTSPQETIALSIPSHQHRTVALTGKRPLQAGDYQLEVTLRQKVGRHHQWLTERGLSFPPYAITLP